MESFYLIFDADDTLWENNIYFEEAFVHFCDYLAHSSLSPDQVRSVLDEVEIVNAKIHGYGSRNFARNLAQCFQHLAERDICERDLETVREYAYAILERTPEVIEGVEETLADLVGRHELALFTKGDPDEQKLKLDRSGLSRFFGHVGIVKEKHEQAYRDLTIGRNYSPERTWMIGNSPKSDINPALSAGLSAVYVPHPRTWSMEKEDVPERHPRLLTIERITELTRHF
ncbi:MAG TPA: HAD hydrolase-like protein [Bryobacteraceae bacterium]|jgi:Predicted hydrolase (HAD superfamily)|nr:HAD hydrolase-like protein [Bryobacteraceae bacterium]